MTEADRIMHDAFSAAIVENLAPEGAMEVQLAQRIATDSWRLNRVSAIEDNLFALGHSAHSGYIQTEDPEIHAALTAAKNLATLQALQSARRAKREAEMNEARKLQQLNEMKGLPHEPIKDGFGFSNAEIRAAIDKDRRLNRANQTHFSRHKPQRLQAKAV